MQLFFQKLNSNKEGFTLIETLVAISIFSFSIVAVMVVLGKGLADTNYAKRKIVAESLAQEGVEYMRNLRDTYVLYGADGARWNSFLARLTNNACNAGTGCYFDPGSLSSSFSDSTQPMANLSMTACGGSCPELRYGASTGGYGYSGSPSGFTRKITADTSVTNEVKISSTVSWTHASGTYNITLSETLFNWAE